MTHAFLAALALAASAIPALAAPDDDFAAAKGEFEAIVHEVRQRDRMTAHGPSLTKLFRDFVSHDPKVVRGVEASAWAAARGKPSEAISEAPAVERVIRFLHEMPARRVGAVMDYGERPGLAFAAGAVVLRGFGGMGYSGPGTGTPLDVSYDALVADKPVRAFPRPRAADLLAVDVPETEAPGTLPWSDSALNDFAMALGEACADDDAAFAELIARAMRDPRRMLPLVALGRTRRPDAVAFLAQTISQKSSRESVSPYAMLTPLQAAIDALKHADAAAYDRVLAGLTDEQRCRAFGKPSFAAIMHSRLAALDAAIGPEARRTATLRVLATDQSLDGSPAKEDAVRLLHLQVACLDGPDPVLRDAVRKDLSDDVGGTLDFSSSGAHGTWSEKGEYVGSLDSGEATLRQYVADVDSGRLQFRDEPLPPDQGAATTDKYRSRLLSDVKFEDAVGAGWIVVPLRVKGAWTDQGLHLAFTNEGRRGLAIDPVSMRYGVAARTVVTTTVEGQPPRSEERFRVMLGTIAINAVVPSRCLVVVRPGEAFEIDLPVRKELRGAPHVGIDLRSPRVVGAAAAPVVCFEWTPIF